MCKIKATAQCPRNNVLNDLPHVIRFRENDIDVRLTDPSVTRIHDTRDSERMWPSRLDAIVVTMAAPSRPSPTIYRGACDASAALLRGDRLVVGNDEDQRLRVYDVAKGGEPLEQFELLRASDCPDGESEADIEGAATLRGITWWIGSHARNDKGKKQPNRRVLVATRVVQGTEGLEFERLGVHHSRRRQGLLGAMLELPTLGRTLSKAERRGPKQRGGFNIEGLSEHRGALAIGLRNPLVSGRAPVVLLHEPEVLLDDRNASLHLEGFTLDLEGRGIRSLSPDPEGDGLLVAAGAIDGAGDFALFRWSGAPDDAPRRIDVDLGGLRVESIVPMPDGRLLALSDDSSVRTDGVRCKDHEPSKRGFRGLVLTLP